MSADTTTTLAAEPARLESIDAIRGIAFLAVLLVHAGQAAPPFPGSHLTTAGSYGVSLFFIASAFTLLASHHHRQSKELQPTRAFFIRRIFRIVPLFWAGIVFYFLLYGTWNRGWAGGSLSWFHFGLTASLLHGWHPDTINSVVPGGWSIAAEFGFYALAPAFFLIITTWRRALLAFALAVAFALVLNAIARGGLVARLFPDVDAWRQGSFTWLWLPAHLPTFLLGFLAFYLRDHVLALTPAQRRAFLWTTCAAIAAAVFFLHGILADYLFPVVLTFFILALVASPVSLLVNRMTCLLGTLSFSAYITHFAALRAIEKILERVHSPLSGTATFLILFFGTLILTTLASTVTYHAIEKPGIALGRRLLRSHRRPLAIPVPL